MAGNQIDQGAHHCNEARPGRVRSLDVSTRETDGTQEAHTREKSTGGRSALRQAGGRVKSLALVMLETIGTRSAHDRELRLFLPGALGMSKEGKPALTTDSKAEPIAHFPG
jgi:hypothetical protein